jgi:hypothetical protein
MQGGAGKIRPADLSDRTTRTSRTTPAQAGVVLSSARSALDKTTLREGHEQEGTGWFPRKAKAEGYEQEETRRFPPVTLLPAKSRHPSGEG